jgi:hypothetical protein
VRIGVEQAAQVEFSDGREVRGVVHGLPLTVT